MTNQIGEQSGRTDYRVCALAVVSDRLARIRRSARGVGHA
jgi:hypothetical protein